MVYSQCDYPAAIAYYERALVMREQLGDRAGMAGSMSSLGNVAQYQGDYERARSLFEQSLAINRETGNRVWEAANLICLGSVCYEMGDHAAVRSYYEQDLAVSRESCLYERFVHALSYKAASKGGWKVSDKLCSRSATLTERGKMRRRIRQIEGSIHETEISYG